MAGEVVNKLNITHPQVWDFHRGGWKYAIDSLLTLHYPGGILFLDWADGYFKKKVPIKKKWCGILHNAINHPKEYLHKYTDTIYSLSDLVESEVWADSKNNCCGIFTLCQHTADYLSKQGIQTYALKHPIEDVPLKFKMPDNPKIVFIGQWLRKFQSFFELECEYPKTCIVRDSWAVDFQEGERLFGRKSKVEVLPYVSNGMYDLILSRNFVFLDFYDVAACNVVLECIIRNTPLLVRKLTGVVEYLGENYPLYFEDIKEANCKAKDIGLFEQAHIYLKSMSKECFSNKFFLKDFASSKIYHDLKVPTIL